MEKYPNKTLVGPSVGVDDIGQQWLSKFMTICESLECRIDYLALHSYSRSIEDDFKIYTKLYVRYEISIKNHCIPNMYLCIVKSTIFISMVFLFQVSKKNLAYRIC